MNDEVIYFFVSEPNLLMQANRLTRIHYPIDTFFLIESLPVPESISKAFPNSQICTIQTIDPIEITKKITQHTENFSSPVAVFLDAEIKNAEDIFQVLSLNVKRVYFMNFTTSPEPLENFVELKPEEQDLMLFDNISELDDSSDLR